MSEPDWKKALRGDVLDAAIKVNQAYQRGDVQSWTPMTDAVLEAVTPHIEAAYQRGLMAGRSQAGYTTRRKPRKEDG